MLPILRRTATTVLVLSLAAVSTVAAQTTKRPLQHEDYDRWQRISDRSLSPDGEWLAYVVQPGDGDGTLVIRSVDGDASLSIARGTGPRFTGDNRFVVASVSPAQDTVKALRRAKVKSDALPKDSLVIVDLSRAFGADGTVQEGGITRVARVKSFRLPDDGAVLAYLLEKEPAADSTRDQQGRRGEEQQAGEEETEKKKPRLDPGTTLVLRTLTEGAEHRYEHVADYRFSDDGALLYYTASSPEGDADGAFRVSTASGEASALLTGDGRYLGLAVQPDGHRMAFVSDRDDREADQPAFALYAADGSGAAHAVATPASAGIPAGWWIAQKGSLSVSRNGERVFFGTRPRPEPEDDDAPEPLPEEKVEVDVWNWKDPYLQPMQLLEREDELNRTYQAWAPFAGGDVVQLETPELENVRVGEDGDADVALALDDGPYRQLISWDGRYVDAWLVDVATGQRHMAQEAIRDGASLSPGGQWIYWWDGSERAWFARPAVGGEPVNLTAAVTQPVYDVLDDHPQPPSSYGMAGWTDDDGMVLIYDQHDIWAVDPRDPARARDITEGVGRREDLRFRYVRLDPEEETIPTDAPLLLSAFQLETKQDGFYRDRVTGDRPPQRLVLEDASFGFPRKADDADRLLFTRETFENFPDLWVSGSDLSGRRKLTSIDAELQSQVRWGTAELTEWISNDGIPLQGILYKPEGFDPSKQYPMLVYFYERMSDGLHRYHIPAAGSSSINFSFYVSRGYLVFVPDIPYEIGHPGESALDAVVPGVLALVEQGFVDPARIGVQGHSWGGYQIAYMVTRTNVFAAAEAGAPVANMTSAYGGIRWGTGMSRAFQYERTQSRIGGSLWEAPLLYIENSPLFTADKIETPLLMMHNDADTAVPWYQGIEMFSAMRRLHKPAWLLNYNGQPHGLRSEADRKDWAIRMQQFFDHYLKDAPSPVWMEEGVPAVLKGKSLGLDLVTGEKAAEQGAAGGS